MKVNPSKILAVLVLLGLSGVILEKLVWKTSQTYPLFLATHKTVKTSVNEKNFPASDARAVCGLKANEDTYENADVAFKQNGTFVRCMNHFISRVYFISSREPERAN